MKNISKNIMVSIIGMMMISASSGWRRARTRIMA